MFLERNPRMLAGAPSKPAFGLGGIPTMSHRGVLRSTKELHELLYC